MTAGRFQEVDLDLLADYVGGALDGTPEQAVVERLISTAPQWRDAHHALVQAMDSVQESLARWGAEQPVMPPDVTARLTSALDAATSSATDPATGVDAGVDALEPPAADPVGPVAVPGTASPLGAGPGRHRPGDDRPTGPGTRPGARPDSGARPHSGGRPPAARRRRWVRLAGPALVTAAVVAFGAVALTRLVPPDGQSEAASTAGGSGHATAVPEQATDASAPRLLLDEAPQQLLASGTDYSPATLTAGVAELARRVRADKEFGVFGSPATARSDRVPTGDPAPAGPMSTIPVPAGLLRLADRTALSACLAAVTGEHGRGPVTVQVVDYASFEGRPALVIVFADGTGARWAWVSGPDCGLPGSGADTRHRARVG